jgi:predicted membrane protein
LYCLTIPKWQRRHGRQKKFTDWFPAFTYSGPETAFLLCLSNLIFTLFTSKTNKMELQTNNNRNESTNTDNRHNRGRAIAGLIVVVVGTVLLARRVGVELPYWIFTWPMLLIAIGLFLGFRHSFRNPGWLFPTGIGLLFLMEHLVPELELRQYIWPIIIICIGLFMIFRPRSRSHGEYWKNWESRDSQSLSDHAFETVTIFGGDKKQIISKDFKGGESVCAFGGVEINLTQADINGTATVEVVQLFGGTKIIVPPHWKVQTDELVCIFGSLEDKRQVAGSVVDGMKVLVIKGTCIFGGIDLRSF